MLFDFHTHKYPQNAENQQAALYNVTLNQSDFTENLMPPLLFSVGLHPWYLSAEKNVQQQMDVLKNYPHLAKAAAIGECGLDRTISVDMALQEAIFLEHAALAETLQKPLIIHCVRAHDRLIALRKARNYRQDWAVHGFTKKAHVAEALWNVGIFASFGAAILDEKKSAPENLKNAPDGLFFLETDTHSASIEEIYEKAAELRGVDVQKISEQIQQNLRTYFQK